MSRFFQQLIARQQGRADTVKPLIAPRFSQLTGPVFAADGLTEPAQPLHPLATGTSANVQSSVRSDALTDTSLPTVQIFSPRVEQPAAPLPADRRDRASSSPTDMAARLAQVSQWMGALATVVDGSQRDHLDVTAPIQEASAADKWEPPQVNVLSSQDSQRSDAPWSDASTTSSPLSTRSSTESVTSLSNPTLAPPQASAPDSAAKKSRLAESAIQPYAQRLQPVSPHSLQPLLQSLLPPVGPPPAPTIQIAIGRLEIRATTPVKPTAQPRRSPLPKRAALSLDQYLQRRSREE